MTLIAVDSIFAVVCVKDVYLAHVYLVRYQRWPCLRGVRKWKLKDCPLKMASSLCWIYDLPMTYFYFAQHWTKRAFCWMSWLPRLHKLGLTLNLKKTKILTTQAQPPQQLQTRGGVTVDVLDRVSTHKWLGCLLHAGGCHDADIDFHLQAALRTFNANRWILTDRHVSLATRFQYFGTIITPVACFAAGHRKILKKISTRLTWHSANCFGAWSAHQLPLTGHGFGMKSCMTGMHAFYNLLNNIPQYVVVVVVVVWKCIGSYHIMRRIYRLIVGWPASWLGPAGDIKVQVVHDTHGTRWSKNFASINNWAFGCGSWFKPVVKFDAAFRDFLCPGMKNTIWGALQCTKCSLSFFSFCALHGLPAGIQVSLHFNFCGWICRICKLKSFRKSCSTICLRRTRECCKCPDGAKAIFGALKCHVNVSHQLLPRYSPVRLRSILMRTESAHECIIGNLWGVHVHLVWGANIWNHIVFEIVFHEMGSSHRWARPIGIFFFSAPF